MLFRDSLCYFLCEIIMPTFVKLFLHIYFRIDFPGSKRNPTQVILSWHGGEVPQIKSNTNNNSNTTSHWYAATLRASHTPHHHQNRCLIAWRRQQQQKKRSRLTHGHTEGRPALDFGSSVGDPELASSCPTECVLCPRDLAGRLRGAPPTRLQLSEARSGPSRTRKTPSPPFPLTPGTFPVLPPSAQGVRDRAPCSSAHSHSTSGLSLEGAPSTQAQNRGGRRWGRWGKSRCRPLLPSGGFSPEGTLGSGQPCLTCCPLGAGRARQAGRRRLGAGDPAGWLGGRRAGGRGGGRGPEAPRNFPASS